MLLNKNIIINSALYYSEYHEYHSYYMLNVWTLSLSFEEEISWSSVSITDLSWESNQNIGEKPWVQFHGFYGFEWTAITNFSLMHFCYFSSAPSRNWLSTFWNCCFKHMLRLITKHKYWKNVVLIMWSEWGSTSTGESFTYTKLIVAVVKWGLSKIGFNVSP